MKVILLRHGQTEWNKLHKYQGHTDISLNDYGRRQAENVAAYLQANEQIEAIYCSDLSRARETAEIIARLLQLSVEIDERWREISFGYWEGMTFTEVYEKYPREYDDWFNNTLQMQVPGGESFSGLLARALPALEEIAAKHCGTVLVVSHGGLIKTLVSHLQGENNLWESYLEPGALSWLEWRQNTFAPQKIGFNVQPGEVPGRPID